MKKSLECLKFAAAAGAGTVAGMSLIAGVCMIVLGLCLNNGFINCEKVGLTNDFITCAGVSATGVLMLGATLLSALKVSGEQFTNNIRDTAAWAGLSTAIGLPMASLFYSMASVPVGQAHNVLENNVAEAVTTVKAIPSQFTFS